MVQVINTLDKTAADSQPAFEHIEAEAVNAAARRPFYQARVKVQPKSTSGTFRSLKWLVMAVTLGIYYIAPWLRWPRPGDAPHQAILIDLAHRRFYFFFIEIWPQEFYYVAGLLIMAGVGLFLITSLVGRAWCGYTCWQTVWTDLFIAVENWAEGDRNARLKLDAAPWSVSKLYKRSLKIGTWFVIAVLTGGFWVFYFADAPTLLKQLVTGQAEPVAYFTIAILTATTFTFAGFMREQVCTYMCPWPRIQGAMLDEHSLVVTYNDWRGEPRSAHRKKVEAAGLKAGDCVDCNACVAVCPMGIDIREGNQLECINCALCIDACNAVMDKIGRPRGLISYSTTYLYNQHVAGRTAPWNWHEMVRPRTIIYFSAWVLVGLVMLYTLIGRERLRVDVVADRNPLYVKLSDGSIRNGYTIKILNMKQAPRSFRLSIADLPGATLQIEGDAQADANGGYDIAVEPDKLKAVKVYVATHDERVVHEEKSTFTVQVDEINAKDAPESNHYHALFHAPEH
jgi:cytochrome c oxidase accessory protein FixG